ncbi:hypothetical protein APY03_5471 [Variovorax sp. WDL1]|nr:hypothetical protein APY03_5471 [Variovorax sp. WDL1]
MVLGSLHSVLCWHFLLGRRAVPGRLLGHEARGRAHYIWGLRGPQPTRCSVFLVVQWHASP